TPCSPLRGCARHVNALETFASRRLRRRAWLLSARLDQIDAVAVEVEEDGDAAVLGVARAFGELDAFGAERGVVGVEVVGVQEEEHAAAGLMADRGALAIVGGAREEQLGAAAARRRQPDPALAVGLRRIFDDDEAEHVAIEALRLVVVAHQERGVGDAEDHQKGVAKSAVSASWSLLSVCTTCAAVQCGATRGSANR